MLNVRMGRTPDSPLLSPGTTPLASLPAPQCLSPHVTDARVTMGPSALGAGLPGALIATGWLLNTSLTFYKLCHLATCHAAFMAVPLRQIIKMNKETSMGSESSI